MVRLFPRLPQMRRMEWEAYLANPHILDDVDPLILDLLSSRSLITVPGRWMGSYWFTFVWPPEDSQRVLNCWPRYHGNTGRPLQLAERYGEEI